MAGTPNKRQRREEYKKQKEALKGENGGQLELPKKKFYRQRAHANPFSDHALSYPERPEDMDWSSHFPAVTDVAKKVEIADIGCGFGGLIIALSPMFPDTLMLGMELRKQVTDYVVNRVAAMRSKHQPSISNSHLNPYQNISAVRSNTMKFLPNYFAQGQLSKIFLCFPDPHFKQRKHKARIVSAQLNAEYAFVLKPGGMLYTITDVEELHRWIASHFDGQEAGDIAQLWERVDASELEHDPCVKVMSEETEESKKVTRNGGQKFIAVWRRKENPEWPE